MSRKHHGKEHDEEKEAQVVERKGWAHEDVGIGMALGDVGWSSLWTTR